MRNMTRAGLIFFAMGALTLAGCDCNPPPAVVQCSDVTVSFTAPAEGASLVAPFDVSIEAKASDGSAFEFEGAKLTIDDGTPVELAVNGSTATFSSVGASAGQHVLKATITKGACGPDAEEASNRIAPANRTVTVTVPCTAKVTGVTFPQDANADGKINLSELPSGTALDVRVVSSCATGAQVQIKNGSNVVSALTDISSGSATVAVPQPDGGIPDGQLTLFAELVANGQPVNNTGSNPEALAAISIQRTPPACSNTTKLLNGPSDDGNTAMADFQLNVTGTVGASALTTSFSIPAQPTQNVTPTLGTVTAQFNLPMTGDTTYDVTLTCSDNAGNTTTDTKTVRLDFAPPTVTITSPSNPDGGPALATQSPTNVVISTNSEDGTDACATRISGATRTSVGCALVASGTATLPVTFSGDGEYGVEVDVTDVAGNVGKATGILIVQLSGCGLGFTRPNACPALLTAAQVSGGNYTFQTQSKATCQGQSVDLTVRTKLADGGVGNSSLVGSGSVAAVTGLATILGPAANGSYLYSATVTNVGADAGTTSVDCDVTVDLDGPAINSPTASTINASQDLAPQVAGAQRLLQFTARVPSGGQVDVCTTQAVDPSSGQPRPAGDCGTNYYLLSSNISSPTPSFTFPEGSYNIKIIVLGGGTIAESAPVSLFVDVTRPCLLAGSRRLPQDLNGDSRLNSVELGSSPPQLEFSLDPSCKDTSPATLAATPVVVLEIVGGSPTGSFAQPTDVTWVSPNFLVNLTQGVSNEKNYVFFVRLADSAGNTNTYAGVGDPSTFTFRIDKVAPSCDITTPSASQTLLGTSQVPSGQFGVTIGTVLDVGDGGVAANLTGSGSPQSALLTPVAPAYQASTTFTVSGTHAWTVAATCTDLSGNATSATSRNLTIDLDPPTCALTSPTTTAPYGTNQILTTMTVGGAEGRPVSCTTDGTPLSPSFLVADGGASETLTYPNGTQTVACSVTDLAANQCTSSVAGVVVNSTACPLSLTNVVSNTNGFWFNSSNTTVNGTSGTANIAAHTATCGASKSVTLVRTAPTAGTPVVQTTDSNGDVTFSNITLSQGETWTVTIDNGASVTTAQTFRVALVSPTATSVTIDSTVIASGSALRFVAAAGNRNVETSTAGYFADLNSSAAGAQLDLAVNGVAGARVFGLDGTVEVLFKGSLLVSQPVTTDPQTFTFAATTLSHNDTGTLEVRLRDAADNQTIAISNTSTIDVIAPGAPSVNQLLTDARAATVSLTWAPTYDDGTDGTSGGNSGYDVRWTTLSVPGVTNGIPDSSTFFGSLVRQESVVAWSALSISHDVTLPPLNTYYLAVRALDEVGNYSTHSAPTALTNWWTQVLLQAPVVSTNFGQSVITAKLNNDALDDIVVSAPAKTGGGAVYVYYGSSPFADHPSCGTGCQELNPPDTSTGQFGSDLSANGNIGDVAGEQRNDLAIGQLWTTTPFSGRVMVYFGSTSDTLSTAQAIEIRGEATIRIGQTAQIIKDINNDQLDELAIAAPLYNANRGRVYVFKGRSQAAWAAARVFPDGGTPYVPITSADFVVDGPTNLLVAQGNAFGQNRFGLISVADINSDSVPDVAIPTSRSSIGRYRILSGAAIAASSPASPLLDGGVPLVDLTQATVADTNVTNGFGSCSVSTNLSGATAADLITVYSGAAGGGRVYIYEDLAPGAVNPTTTIIGPSSFGYQVVARSLNTADSRIDIVSGQKTGGLAWILYQQTGARIWDGTGTGTIGSTAEFWVSKFDGPTIAGTASTTLGRSVVVCDVDGLDGPDVILGDETVGQVRIWR